MQPGWKSPPLGYISICPTGFCIPILRSGEPLVKVCTTSTKTASSGESRAECSAYSKWGPAGSKPLQNGRKDGYCRLEVTTDQLCNRLSMKL